MTIGTSTPSLGRTAERCLGCARHYDRDAIGYHASRHWIGAPAGLICRTCRARINAGTLDITSATPARAQA